MLLLVLLVGTVRRPSEMLSAAKFGSPSSESPVEGSLGGGGGIVAPGKGGGGGGNSILGTGGGGGNPVEGKGGGGGGSSAGGSGGGGGGGIADKGGSDGTGVGVAVRSVGRDSGKNGGGGGAGMTETSRSSVDIRVAFFPQFAADDTLTLLLFSSGLQSDTIRSQSQTRSVCVNVERWIGFITDRTSQFGAPFGPPRTLNDGKDGRFVLTSVCLSLEISKLRRRELGEAIFFSLFSVV